MFAKRLAAWLCCINPVKNTTRFRHETRRPSVLRALMLDHLHAECNKQYTKASCMAVLEKFPERRLRDAVGPERVAYHQQSNTAKAKTT